MPGSKPLFKLGKIPPLPPRKPAHARAVSLTPQQPPATLTRSNQIRPPIHPLGVPEQTHADSIAKQISTSTLMKQSLQASKTGLTLKRAQEQLEKERVLEIIQSSSRSAEIKPSEPRSRSRSPDQASASHVSARHRAPSPPLPSATSSSEVNLEHITSVMSLNQSPSGQWANRTTGCVTSPERGSLSGSLSRSVITDPQFVDSIRVTSPRKPPPLHPDRKPPRPPALETSKPRPTRSKSLHHHSPTPLPNSPPSPPPRRRRPESVQISPLRDGDGEYSTSPFTQTFLAAEPRTPNNGVYGPSRLNNGHTRSFSDFTHHRSLDGNPSTPRYSVSSTTSSHLNSTSLAPSVMPGQNSAFESDSLSNALSSSLQKTLNQLQPKFDRARYKAEAGLTRRGFVQHRDMSGDESEQRLTHHIYGRNGSEDDGYAIVSDDENGRSVAERSLLDINSLQA